MRKTNQPGAEPAYLFEDRQSPGDWHVQWTDDEGGFEDYTQICVVGVRRAEPREPLAADQRRLQGYRYHTPSPPEQGKSASRIRSGWEHGT